MCSCVSQLGWSSSEGGRQEALLMQAIQQTKGYKVTVFWANVVEPRVTVLRWQQ